MNPKIQLEADADGSATSSGWSSSIGPLTMISGVARGFCVGTSTLSMAVGAGVEDRVVEVVGRRVGDAVRWAVGAGVGATEGFGVGLGCCVGGGPPDGVGHSPKSSSKGLVQSAWTGACVSANAPNNTRATATSRPRRVIRDVLYVVGAAEATAHVRKRSGHWLPVDTTCTVRSRRNWRK